MFRNIGGAHLENVRAGVGFAGIWANEGGSSLLHHVAVDSDRVDKKKRGLCEVGAQYNETEHTIQAPNSDTNRFGAPLLPLSARSNTFDDARVTTWMRFPRRATTLAVGVAATTPFVALAERHSPVNMEDLSARQHGRQDSDPPPAITAAQARHLVRTWTLEEEESGYYPKRGKWPEIETSRSEIPVLRRELDNCGSPEQRWCHAVTFRLATALLGGTLHGHISEQSATSTEECAEGAALMHTLAMNGSAEGACGWAFCLANGEAVPEDTERAAQFHR